MGTIRGFLLPAASLALLTVAITVADTQRMPNVRFVSHYTTIDPEKCGQAEAAVISLYEAAGLDAVDCGGMGGWRIFNVSSPERSWLDVSNGDKIWTTENVIVYEDPIGDFPNVGAPKAEWILADSDLPVALIFRIAALRSNTGTSERVSKLYVIGLGPQPRLCGRYATNEQARAAAKAPEECSDLLRLRH